VPDNVFKTLGGITSFWRNRFFNARVVILWNELDEKAIGVETDLTNSRES